MEFTRASKNVLAASAPLVGGGDEVHHRTATSDDSSELDQLLDELLALEKEPSDAIAADAPPPSLACTGLDKLCVAFHFLLWAQVGIPSLTTPQEAESSGQQLPHWGLVAGCCLLYALSTLLYRHSLAGLDLQVSRTHPAFLVSEAVIVLALALCYCDRVLVALCLLAVAQIVLAMAAILVSVYGMCFREETVPVIVDGVRYYY